ncbi:MAG TPA: LysM peptidoglycan-binding domain-containing protein [Gemmatimonadales bacterium]|nr:LysM peptidoglycan-binding domain-containing protein [Gemmatimonadales bacterium]
MPRSCRWSWLGALALVASPTLALGQAPESHTVREGDTLWDLARTYRGDPFLWPDIYRMNTNVVEDPHWIYPGEVLRLAASEGIASVPSTDTPAPADTTAVAEAPSSEPEPAAADPSEAPAAPASLNTLLKENSASLASDDTESLFGPRRGRTMQETMRAYVEQPYRPLRRSEFYSSGFLSEGDDLPYGQVLGMVTPPQIKAMARNMSALPYTMVSLQAPRGAAYQVGDTLLLVRTGPHMGSYGDVVIPTGLAQVMDTADGKYLAEVVAIYDAIRAGQKSLPAESFGGAGGARAVPMEGGVTARLVGGPKRQDLKAPQMVVFLDKGRRDGVAAGDLFEIRRTPERLPDGSIRVDDVMATLQVVHVRERTATARVLNVISPDIESGTPARQVAKLPS